jgi:Ca2+-binding RTX toxin-like protein
MRRSLLTVSVLLAALAPAASAATVRTEAAPVFGEAQARVLVDDPSGERNGIDIAYTYAVEDEAPGRPPGDAVVTVRDALAPLEALDGCTKEADESVRCEVRGLVAVEARLGAGMDSATVTGPRGGLSCGCVTLFGGGDADWLKTLDGGVLHGEGGDDLLEGEEAAAEGTHGSRGLQDEWLEGGEGNDRLRGGPGMDLLAGGTGDDVLAGGPGDDSLSGGPGVGAPPPGPSAGDDRLDGGDGNDFLSDGDVAAPDWQPGPDVLVGGRGDDRVGSYSMRTAPLHIDLSSRGGDGARGEGDDLVNVEAVMGGRGDDTIVGDGDANQLAGGRGDNRLRGRGGDDVLTSAAGRTRLDGDRGDDVLEASRRSLGPVSCGPGRDFVRQRRTQPGQYRGPLVSASCESIGLDRTRSWALSPVPTKLSRRLLLLARTRRSGAGA